MFAFGRPVRPLRPGGEQTSPTIPLKKGEIRWKAGRGEDHKRWVEIILYPELPPEASKVFPWVAFRIYIGPDNEGNTGVWLYPSDMDMRIRKWLDAQEAVDKKNGKKDKPPPEGLETI